MALVAQGGGSPDPKELEALKALIQGGGGAASGGGKVYMGTTSQLSAGGQNPDYLTPAAEAQLSRRKVDMWATESEALGAFYDWDVRKQGDFLAKGIVGGLLKLGDGPMEAGALWAKLVKEAAKYGKADQKVTPFDLLNSYIGSSSGKGDWVRQGDFEINVRTGERRYVGPQFKTQTDTRTDLTDPDTAKAIATKLFQDMMGRDPGAGELGAFAKALNTAEQNSPVTQVSTTEYDMKTGEPLGTKTTSSGGMTAEARAYLGEQQIKKKKEYGVNQAVTTYQNAFENLIFGSPG